MGIRGNAGEIVQIASVGELIDYTHIVLALAN
jgi:hypothetical protein